MRKKVLILGLFSIIVAVTSVFFILRSTNPVGNSSYILYSRLTDASGLFPETDIRIAGVRIGKIKEISLIDNQALLTLEVDSEIPLPNGSFLRRKPLGLLGNFNLEIAPGTGEEPLKPNDFIAYREQPGLLDTLDASASDITEDISSITRSIDEYIGNSGILENISAVVQELQTSLQYINILLATVEQSAEANAASINEILPAFSSIARSLESALVGGSDGIGSAPGGSEGLGSFQESIQQLNEIIVKINAGEGSLGKIINDDTLYNSIEKSVVTLNETIENVNTVTSSVSDLETTFDYRAENLVSENFEYVLKNHVNMEFKIPKSSREYHIGITYGGGENLIPAELPQYPDIGTTGLKLNLIVGQSLFNDYVTLLGGIIENTGGFRVDVNPFKEWTISAEVYNFNFQNRFGPNLRAHTRVEPFRFLEGSDNPLQWLYFNAGADDILGNFRRMYFVGVGLQIKDNFFYDAVTVLPVANTVRGLAN